MNWTVIVWTRISGEVKHTIEVDELIDVCFIIASHKHFNSVVDLNVSNWYDFTFLMLDITKDKSCEDWSDPKAKVFLTIIVTPSGITEHVNGTVDLPDLVGCIIRTGSGLISFGIILRICVIVFVWHEQEAQLKTFFIAEHAIETYRRDVGVDW